jgi:hypothetical protein
MFRHIDDKESWSEYLEGEVNSGPTYSVVGKTECHKG